MSRKNHIKATKLDVALNVVNITFLVLIAFTMLYPFWEILVKSVMTDEQIIRQTMFFWPSDFQWSGYKTIFTDTTYNFGRAFLNSVYITMVDTIYQLTITAFSAYALSRKTLPGRKFLFFYFIFTMYFGGGMIPYYLVIRSLGLRDTLLVMIIPSFISVFNVLVMLAFFRELPQELEEAAIIDGAGHFQVFLVVVLPLSKAVLATIALFIMVGVWNNWYSAMLYITSAEKRPLAYALQVIIEKSRGVNIDGGGNMGGAQIIGKSVQYAAIVVTVFPIMMIYPFFQKHFVKGVLIGSIKG